MDSNLLTCKIAQNIFTRCLGSLKNFRVRGVISGNPGAGEVAKYFYISGYFFFKFLNINTHMYLEKQNLTFSISSGWEAKNAEFQAKH